jgi:hypothetical protein
MKMPSQRRLKATPIDPNATQSNTRVASQVNGRPNPSKDAAPPCAPCTSLVATAATTASAGLTKLRIVRGFSAYLQMADTNDPVTRPSILQEAITNFTAGIHSELWLGSQWISVFGAMVSAQLIGIIDNCRYVTHRVWRDYRTFVAGELRQRKAEVTSALRNGQIEQIDRR